MKKFRLLFALGFLVLSQATYSGANMAPAPVAQAETAVTFRELVRQALATEAARPAAELYLRAAEVAPDNEQRYWALVEAGKQLHEAQDYPQAIATFTRAEKLDGIIDLARFDAGLNAAYSVLAQMEINAQNWPAAKVALDELDKQQPTAAEKKDADLLRATLPALP